MSASDPEFGRNVEAAGLKTNFLEQGTGPPVLLIHGSGPGVTAYANWRLTIPALATRFRVIAPDMAGFGYTDRKPGVTYDLEFWLRHLAGLMDALAIPRAHLVGNSFGGAVALAFASRYPQRVEKLVLMGAAGIDFPLTPGLDAVWGYEPSLDNMRRIAQSFAYDRSLITEDLVRSRYEASIRPGFHESYSSLFPAPRQRHIAALATPDDVVRKLPHQTLIVHGRDDRIIPLATSVKLLSLIERSELHVFGQCGHWTQIEKKDRFKRLVEVFLA